MSFPPVPGSALDVVRTWDARADLYLRLFRHELAAKPYDLQVLAGFAKRVGAGGRVLDAGCGPCGHVTAVLAGHGLDVVGVDLSPRCVELARREHPGLRFEVLDQRSPAPGLDGLVSYYSLHDQPRSELTATFTAWAAALRPGGHLLVVAKEGAADGVVDDPLGTGLRVYWAEHTAAGLRAAAEQAGYTVVDLDVRAAYDAEIPTRRLYLSAVSAETPSADA